MRDDHPRAARKKSGAENLHPHRWKAAEFGWGGTTYQVHADRKVYVAKANGLRRVRDPSLAAAVYGAFVASQEQKIIPGDPTR